MPINTIVFLNAILQETVTFFHSGLVCHLASFTFGYIF